MAGIFVATFYVLAAVMGVGFFCHDAYATRRRRRSDDPYG